MAMSQHDARRARAGKNESLFREVNERIEDSTQDFSEELEPTKMFDFLCECSHPDCIERIRMTHGEYEALRRVPTHFAIRSGHGINEVESIVASNESSGRLGHSPASPPPRMRLSSLLARYVSEVRDA